MLPATQTYNLLPSAIEIEQVIKFATILSNTNFCPPRFRKKPEDTFAAIMMGLEVGLKPLQAVQDIAVINERPSVYGDAALGLIKSSGKLEYIEERIEGDVKTHPIAICIAKRKNEKNEDKRTFSLADAQCAGLLTKDTYKKYLLRMLQMRARSWCLRDVFPDVLKGLHIREEIEDIPVEKEILSPTDSSQTLIEELKQQLISEKKFSVMEISQKINAAKTHDELNQIKQEIKNGDYSEVDKTEMRQIFKEKKAALK